MEKNLFWKGVKHVISPTVINKYDLVKLVADTYDLGLSVSPTDTDTMCDRSLTSTRTDVMFEDIPELKDQIIEMKKFYGKLKKEKI